MEIGTALMGSKSPNGGGADAASRNRAAELGDVDVDDVVVEVS
jgi:hypothetical protein